MFFYLRSKSTPRESLELIIPPAEIDYAQRLVLPLLPPSVRTDPSHSEGSLFVYSAASFSSIEIPRFLAYLGRLEVFHAQFVLLMLAGQMVAFQGSPDSASRLLRRIYKRLTKTGKVESEAYICDSRLDKGVTLMYHNELKLLVLVAGSKQPLLTGWAGEDLREIRSHFAPFGIEVDVIS